MCQPATRPHPPRSFSLRPPRPDLRPAPIVLESKQGPNCPQLAWLCPVIPLLLRPGPAGAQPQPHQGQPTVCWLCDVATDDHSLPLGPCELQLGDPKQARASGRGPEGLGRAGGTQPETLASLATLLPESLLLLATWGLSCSSQRGRCMLRSTLSGPLTARPAAGTAIQTGSLPPRAGIQPQVCYLQLSGQSPCAPVAGHMRTRRPGPPFTLLGFLVRWPTATTLRPWAGPQQGSFLLGCSPA